MRHRLHQPLSLQRLPNRHDTGTVLLHLYAAALYRRFQKHTAIPSLYIPLPSPFHELESFIHESIKTYDLELFLCLSTKTKEGVQLAVETVMTPASGIPSQPKKGGGEGMKKALEGYKNKFPNVEGILIGTRRTDPYSGAFRVLRWVVNSVGDSPHRQTWVQKPDRPRVARFRPNQPDHQLVLLGCLGILEEVRGPVLFPLRPRVGSPLSLFDGLG